MGNWISVNEKLPGTTHDILIAWIDKNPIEYSEDVKNSPKISVGYYESHKWYVYSETLKTISDDMEIIAWMTKPW